MRDTKYLPDLAPFEHLSIPEIGRQLWRVCRNHFTEFILHSSSDFLREAASFGTKQTSRLRLAADDLCIEAGLFTKISSRSRPKFAGSGRGASSGLTFVDTEDRFP
jgi:hypothetical protein